MSHWNHRVLAKEIEGELILEIYEVYYDDESKPRGYSSPPARAYDNNLEGLREQLEWMQRALSSPILWGDDRFPEQYHPESE